MSDQMVRKQFYISKRQDALLKQRAKQRGVSEAEVIRQAIEHEIDKFNRGKIHDESTSHWIIDDEENR